ncbi:XrtA/PEP-CTERM system histidine kinase PrsK [Sphingomonas mesophila]|uniref:XrtA/PEP-CTERM system histidine kinase PrsK n=1 Tax=Sphingomonas mesophila TaxID=2303576 RepID=UPI000E5733E6|nr:XrtA/PEP-CTERM system histidine kinase PrsK [Sphingomonas mesophila]
MSESLTVGSANSVLAFGGYAAAALLFSALILWRARRGVGQPAERLLLAGFALTACWAWLSALAPAAAFAGLAETFRNLVWLALLHSLSGGREHVERQPGLRLVYGAVGLVLGLELVAGLLGPAFGVDPVPAATEALLRITAAAGLLILVHNLYAQADAPSRQAIGAAMLALVATWGVDLNLYTLAYLDPATSPWLAEWRGLAAALTAPLFAIAAGRADGWRIRLSRDATFQSLSLLGICAYFATMTILASALGRSGIDWSRPLLAAVLGLLVVGGLVLGSSPAARAWARVKLTKHLFEHRYDYRGEWLRFADTVGRSGVDAPPVGERLIKAFADIMDSPGGLLLAIDGDGQIAEAARRNWSGETFAPDPLDALRWSELEANPRILALDRMREAPDTTPRLPLPNWLTDSHDAWAGVPLVHSGRLVGLVILAAPPQRRDLDWEDFDLLKTAGRQAAATLAEAHGQQALARAERFDEFNRRFAFILHDIKNLVSQLSLVARNAERHADNPDFRADMVATLKSSVGKMNDLLARLGPAADNRQPRLEPVPLRNIVAAAIAGKRGAHEVSLSGEGGWVLADPLLLDQAIAHLVQNAIDASPVGDPVTVRMASGEHGASIVIADRGAGMDSEFVRSRLFEPFASTKDGGFGIGAFEARAIIQAMGGRLGVDTAPGRGSRFTIHLPAAPAPSLDQRKSA